MVQVGAPVPVGQVVAGKYRIERVIGAGGMGVVYDVTHLQLQQPVALKFLLSTYGTPEAVERFMREARAAVRLKSEDVAGGVDLAVLDDGVAYMELGLPERHDRAP